MAQRIHKPKRLTSTDVQRIRGENLRRDHELERLAGLQEFEGKERPSEVYLLPRGAVAWCWGETGLEFAEYEEFAGSVRAAAGNAPQHILVGYQLFSHDFADAARELAKGFLEKVGMHGPTFSVSEFRSAMKLVGERRPEAFLVPGTFECIVAYVGEHLCLQRRGHWEIRSVGGVWEPHVVVGDQRRAVFFEIWETLNDGRVPAPEQV